ncbi:MAG: enoyl-CoA hydratase, partial [Mycobacterium sp.]
MASPDLTNSNSESVPQEPAQQVTYETLDEGRIARIWLNRPEAQNA